MVARKVIAEKCPGAFPEHKFYCNDFNDNSANMKHQYRIGIDLLEGSSSGKDL